MSQNKYKTEKTHSSRHRSSLSSHSSSNRNSHYNSTSEMEKRRKNIIYVKARNERLQLMVKRIIFCVSLIAVILYIIFSIISSSGSSTDFDFFNNGVSIEKVNELNNKIIEYEFYIEELEERLSEYEDVDGIFIKSKKHEQ